MARFRTSGRNWEGREWYLAPSLVVLARQIEDLHPAPQPGDGTVASKAHDQNSPSSDHRPRPFTGKGIVRALDGGEDRDDDPMVTALANSRDPRIAYIIYEDRAIRSYDRPGQPAWTWQDYTGPNPHAGHFHLSTLRDSTADNDTRPWTIVEDDMAKIPLEWWAEDAFKWAIDNGLYTEQTDLAKVREEYDFQQLVVMQHRYARKFGGNTGGLTEAQVKAIINGSQIIAP